MRVLHLFSSGLSKDILVLYTSLFFLDPTSQDLRSHRLDYHYGIACVGLKLIYLDAASIILQDFTCIYFKEFLNQLDLLYIYNRPRVICM
jgi:hypothetical protein